MKSAPTFPNDAQPQPAHRLSIPRDILIAPQRAFATIAEQPSWLPAYAIYAICSLVSVMLSAPALAHVWTLQAPTFPEMRGMSAAQVAREINADLQLQGLSSLIWPLLVWAQASIVFLLVGRKGGMKVFATYFSLNANAAIPAGIGALLAGIAIHQHDSQSIHTVAQLATALPDNLAVFTKASASPAELYFLSQFDVFVLWSTILTGYGLAKIGDLPPWVALTIAFSFQVIAALVSVALTSG